MPSQNSVKHVQVYYTQRRVPRNNFGNQYDISGSNSFNPKVDIKYIKLIILINHVKLLGNLLLDSNIFVLVDHVIVNQGSANLLS